MTLPITIPYTFANATDAIPLTQLDSDFSTVSDAINGIDSGTNVLANANAYGYTTIVTEPGGPYTNTYGSKWRTEYHANWNVVRTQVPYNPTEWQIYPNAAHGIVATVSGTNQITWVYGSLFNTSWIGLNYLYINGVLYKVATVPSSTSMTVQTTSGGAVIWPSSINATYYFCTTSNMGTVNTNGTSVTLASGQPFNGLVSAITINSVSYNISSWNNGSSLTLSTSAGIQTNVSYAQYQNINNELSTLRLQGLNGSSEENFAITFTPAGTLMQSLYAGLGQYRPIKIGTGENPISTIQSMVNLYPNSTLGNPGTLLLGGDFNSEVINISCDSNTVNYFYVQGGPTGFSPSIAARGTDTNIGLAFDTKNTGNISFTSHGFGNFEFQIFGSGGTSWLAVGSNASAAPFISANGSDTNIDISLIPKGSGAVRLGAYTITAPSATGYITVKDSTGTVRKILCA